MKVKVDIFSAFTSLDRGGNTAGVVIDEGSLNDITMQKIAAKVGLSETAFVKKGMEADFTLRFFTPNSEVDLCGHATIAAFALLRNLNIIDAGTYKTKTNAGIQKIDVSVDGNIYMTQNRPVFSEYLSINEIKECFDTDEEIINQDLPIQVVSTGLRDIIVPINDLNTLWLLKPNTKKIKELSSKYNVIGLHAFCLETLNNSTAHCRNFAPLYGIDEESATGTSNGALSCYLYQHKQLMGIQSDKIKIEQGYIMKKPSSITVMLEVEKDAIVRVKVGGSVSKIKVIEIDV